ncbi:MAG: sacsin N-terminal ATP-binding-like domain-containing protein, partial [Actinomycetota bacterium]
MSRKKVFDASEWEGRESPIAQAIVKQSEDRLAAYRSDPTLVAEHLGIERSTAQGGYGRRQVYELIQNAADAMIDHPGGRIRVLLTPESLYCANEGLPIDLGGVRVILSSHVSSKRGNEIGRFGLGFKSILGITDSPEFYSRSGSFGFSRDNATKQVR